MDAARAESAASRRRCRACSPRPTRRSIAWRCTPSGASCSRRRRDAAGLPLHVVPLPWPCSNEEYEAIMRRGRGRVRARGLHARRVRRPVSRGRAPLSRGAPRRHRPEPLFPLWKTKPTADLAREMIDGGLQARLTCVDPRKLDRVVRRPRVRSRAAGRSAAGRRSVRRERRVPLVRVCRPDVHRRRSTSTSARSSTATASCLPI